MSGGETDLSAFRSRHRKALAIAMESALALTLVVDGAKGVSKDGLVVPVIRHDTGNFFKSAHITEYRHFHGMAAWLICAAFLSITAGCALMIGKQIQAAPGGFLFTEIGAND